MTEEIPSPVPADEPAPAVAPEDPERMLVYPDIVKLVVHVLRLKCPKCKVISDITEDGPVEAFAKGRDIRATCTDCSQKLLLVRSRVKQAAARAMGPRRG